MGFLAYLLRWLGGGAQPMPASDPSPAQPDSPFGALDAAKDRVAAAIAAREDLDPAAKANAASNIKGLYYMMLAARDLARSNDPEAGAQVRMLVERAESGTAAFLRELRGLGPAGNDQARDFEVAFRACRDAIAAQLPP